MDRVVEAKKPPGLKRGNFDRGAGFSHATAVEPRSSHPMLHLQHLAGNRAVAAMLRRGSGTFGRSLAGDPLATTVDGHTAFAPQALNDRRFPEIVAHEAVHRAQFRA